MKPTWNLMGMGNNQCFGSKVHIGQKADGRASNSNSQLAWSTTDRRMDNEIGSERSRCPAIWKVVDQGEAKEEAPVPVDAKKN
jgi:hypothetical protein